MPDAECPRCGAMQPPPESPLATCAACGLVFTPHEILHKPPPPKPLPHAPPGVIATRDDERIIIYWPMQRWVAAFELAMALLFAWPARELWRWWWPASIPTILVVAAWIYLAAVALVSSNILTIESASITYRTGPLPRTRPRIEPLAGITSARVRAVRRPESMFGDLFALELFRADRRKKLVLSSREQRPIDYLADVLHQQRSLPIARLDEE